jgi:hypothetical protein
MEVRSGCGAETSGRTQKIHVPCMRQGQIKEFLGPRHFLSLGPFGDSKSIFGTTVYSQLSGLMEGGGDARIIEKHG